MVDIEKQVAHWREGGKEEWTVAQELIDLGHFRHGLFHAHLAMEKILKAHVCLNTRELAPRIHNLVKLAEMGALDVSAKHRDALAEMNAFNLEGRYP